MCKSMIWTRRNYNYRNNKFDYAKIEYEMYIGQENVLNIPDRHKKYDMDSLKALIKAITSYNVIDDG